MMQFRVGGGSVINTGDIPHGILRNYELPVALDVSILIIIN